MSRKKSKAKVVIRIDPMKPVGIQKAIAQLTREKKRLEKDYDLGAFLDKVALDMIATIYARQLRVMDHGGNKKWTLPYYERDGNTRIIKQHGEQIAFIEFGAGAEAGNGNYLDLGFYPGSWSEQNAKTYQEWVDSGYQGLYRYEQRPARGFDTAISDIHMIVQKAADEVFGKK